MTNMTPDLAEARRLLDAGMTLVPLHPHSKRPIGENWNKQAATAIDSSATGYGLPLAPNGLASIDPDHYEMARVGVAAWGFDLDEILAAGVRTESTRPDSGGRAAFQSDPEEMARWLAFRVFDDEGNGITVLELRDQSANLQDVVPGLVYADKHGEVFTQRYANGKRFDDAPSLPDEFARFWRSLSVNDDEFREKSKQFVEAIQAAGFKVNEKRPQHRPPMGNGQSLAFSAPGHRGAFNRKYRVEDVLDRHGYLYHSKDRRWSHPGATGGPGIRPIPGKDELWQSDHGGDPLHGTFDAWAAFVQLDHGGDVEAAKAAFQKERDDQTAADFDPAQLTAAPVPDSTPGHPDTLMDLPHGLGEVQAYIWGRMKYPSPATAGMGALATLTYFAQTHITIDSFQGLGFNEQYLILAPTGWGKEDLREPVAKLANQLEFDACELPTLQFAAPSSAQGLHSQLEEHRSQYYLADEFAHWLGQTHSDSHKQATLGQLMQAYTKALGTINAPHAVTRQYKPVKSPRVSALATTTAEHLFANMSRGQADSGAYNRWLLYVAEQERIEKRYRGLKYQPSTEVVDVVRWIATLPETEMTFTEGAWDYYIEHDSTVIEPLKFDDNHLAGRLSEQAIKIAGLIALSDRRTEIDRADLLAAYDIREGIYHRAKAIADADGALSDRHVTAKALDDLTEAFKKYATIYKSNFPKYSRTYRQLSLPEQQAVEKALIGNGVAADDPDSRKRMRSLMASAG